MALRRPGIEAMGGRKWFDGGGRLELTCRQPESGSISDLFPYLSGVMDTLGGSHAPSFIYLPIIYLDDGQVTAASVGGEIAPIEGYTIKIEFVEPTHHWQQRALSPPSSR